MAQTRLQYLFQKYIDKEITAEEKQELLDLSRLDENEEALAEMMDKVIKEAMPLAQDQETREAIFQSILLARPGAKVKVIGSNRWWKYIAAALIVGILATVAIRMIVGGNATKEQRNEAAVKQDVPAPQNTRAVITLADGSKVYLDSANNGTIAQQNNVSVVKNNEGAISYQLLAISQQPTAYNTLFNPRGSKVISLTLSDGTRVWLNSESSLKYPIAFAGNNRDVEITGEAYFEVKHDAKQPFKVHLPNGSVIEDIGTSFNVNAYTDEASIKTTLIEGLVRVVGDAVLNTNNGVIDHGVILKPGQQAVLNTLNLQLLTFSSPDLEEVLAWKNGKFVFNKTDIQATMRQIARWYDVDIEYRGDVKGGFIGSMPRKENASQVLKMLEMTGAVHFQIEGKKIIVSK